MKTTQFGKRLGSARGDQAELERQQHEIGEPLPSVEIGSAAGQCQDEDRNYRDNSLDPLPEIDNGLAVEKYRSLVYYPYSMGDKEARFRSVAADEGLTVEELRSLIDNWNATRRITQRGHGADAGDDTRPEFGPATPPAEPGRQAVADTREVEVSRPRPQWSDYKDTMTLPKFVAWAYAAEREAGTLTKATLRADFDLYTDYFNWRRRKNLPTKQHWLRDLPRQKELDDRQPVPAPTRLEEFDERTQEAVRLYQRSRQRRYRRAHSMG